MKLLKQIIFFVLLLSVGTVSAVPTAIDDRVEYSQSLNSIASVIMNWYGSLLADDNKTSFDAIIIDEQWQPYRSQYPKNITQVVITKTKLLKQGDDYQFNIQSKISYQENNKAYTNSFNETFILSNAHVHLPKIKAITLNNTENTEVFNTKGYNRKHYKVREFTYAWLSYLDGLNTFNTVMNASQWMDTATYSLDMGNVKIQGLVAETLERRKEVLATGGHLLRSLELKDIADSENTFVIDIILEWKGKNPSGKPVLARVRQEIKIHIKEDKTWQVIFIKEKHLLPIIAPWMGLLC